MPTNVVEKKNVTRAKYCVKYFKWDENEERTDSMFTMEIRPMPDCDERFDLTKDDVIWIVEEYSSIFTNGEGFHIDAIHYEVDGDVDYDLVNIRAEVHLAE